SPPFSLIGYTSATLSFWHYLRRIGGDVFNVEVSTNGGGSWTPVAQYTSAQGAPTAFANATVDLSAFLLSPSVMLRFSFESNWGYGWAIDNIQINGTIATGLARSPHTGQHNDAAATDPYIAGTELAIVYAKPLVTTVYTATVSSANLCTSSGTITVNVDPAPVAGTITADQVLCSGSPPADITLTGHTGNIVR